MPGGRKQHHRQTALIGGIVVFVASCFACLFLPFSIAPYRVFFILAAVLVAVGVLDDLHELSALLRLLIQCLVGMLIVIWGHNSLANLGDIIFVSQLHLDTVSQIIISVCAVIGLVNAINMLDGIDGLVSSLVIVQLSFFIYLAYSSGFIEIASFLGVINAALLGFWCLNFPFPGRKHALVFLGDAGSLFLGFILLWFSIFLSQEPHRTVSPVIFLWIMIVPLYDMCTTILRRIFHKKSPMLADREHIHFLLLKMGLSPLLTVCCLALVTFLASFIGIISNTHIASNIMFIIFIGLGMVYCFFVELMWRRISNAK